MRKILMVAALMILDLSAGQAEEPNLIDVAKSYQKMAHEALDGSVAAMARVYHLEEVIEKKKKAVS